MKKLLIACLMTLLICVPASAKENPVPQKEQKQHQKQEHKEQKEKKEQQQKEAKKESSIKKPDSVVDIGQQNTYPNPNQNEPQLQPSSMTKELFSTTDVEIENPTLIRLLNESSINTSKLSIGYKARIYLGKWPLNYKSNKTTVNWEYKKINENQLDNRGGQQIQNLTYNQESQAKISGGLTAHVPDEKEVKKLMMMEATDKTDLPIAFDTYVGRATKVERVYHVEPKKLGHLSGYVPAVNEKGKVTYGEVYLVLKGGHKYIEVKNVTQQGIGAWIPIQDHIALRYFVSN